MDLQQAPAPGAIVQAIDVLRHQREVGSAALDLSQRAMAGVGLGGSDHAAPPVVPLQDELRVAGEGFRRGQVLGAVLAPQAARAAKCRDTAFD